MNIDPMTIVFAIVAVFVCWRLWSVLGTRTGTERPPMQGPGAARVGGNIVDIAPPPPPTADRWRGFAEPGSPLARGLDAVAANDPSFDPAHFLAGARAAHDMIVGAFAAGDVNTLRGLLAPGPFADFSRAIETRNAAGRRMTVTPVSLDKCEIVDAATRNGAALVTVKFVAKMTSVTTDSSGAVVEGSPTEVAEHIDIWTFARPIGARDPNWLLSETQAPH